MSIFHVTFHLNKSQSVSVKKIQSNLSYEVTSIKQSPVFKGLLFLFCHRKFHMNLISFERSLYLTSFKRSPVLKDHFIFVSKMTT